jgi:hypothetical protein
LLYYFHYMSATIDFWRHKLCSNKQFVCENWYLFYSTIYVFFSNIHTHFVYTSFSLHVCLQLLCLAIFYSILWWSLFLILNRICLTKIIYVYLVRGEVYRTFFSSLAFTSFKFVIFFHMFFLSSQSQCSKCLLIFFIFDSGGLSSFLPVPAIIIWFSFYLSILHVSNPRWSM